MQALYVPPPDLEARYETLLVHTRKMKLGGDVDLKSIAEDTEFFTGADLEGLCREAGIVALREDISATTVWDRHFQLAKVSLKPTLAAEVVESYSKFSNHSSLRATHDAPNSRGTEEMRFGLLGRFKVGLAGIMFLALAGFLSGRFDQKRIDPTAT